MEAEIKIDSRDFSGAASLLSIVEGCQPVQDIRSQAAYLRGLGALRMGNHQLARQRFKDMLQLYPNAYRSMLALGYLENLEGRNVASATYYHRAVVTLENLLAGKESNWTPSAPNVFRWQGHLKTARRALRLIKEQQSS